MNPVSEELSRNDFACEGKITPCVVGQNTFTTSPRSCPQEGRFAMVTNVGRGMRWTCWRVATKRTDADGEVVWSRYPDADIKSRT